MKKIVLLLLILLIIFSCSTLTVKGPVIQGRVLAGSYLMDKGDIRMERVSGFLIVPVKNDLYMITCNFRGNDISEVNEIFPLIRKGDKFLAKKKDVSITLALDDTGILFIIKDDDEIEWHFKKID